MANYTTYISDYNYSKQDVNILRFRYESQFKNEVSYQANPGYYVRMKIVKRRTKYEYNYIYKKVVEKKVLTSRIASGESLVIQLGGPFAEIGGADENVGGGRQKLG